MHDLRSIHLQYAVKELYSQGMEHIQRVPKEHISMGAC